MTDKVVETVQELLRQRTLTLSDVASPFGCCTFFDECADEIMSLHYRGRLGLLDWMGFNVSDVCHRSMDFITFVRPEHIQGTPTGAYLSDACATPHGIEYGAAKITVEDFGRLGRTGPTRDIMKPKYWCKTSPRRRLDGSPVTSEMEWDMRFAMDTILDDVRRMLITGNAGTPGQFDGLQRWVRTGFNASILDATVIDWNGNPMTGGAGITWNGAPIAATFDVIDVLLAAYRRIRQRIMWSSVLSAQPPQVGDMILVLPSFMINCLLDFFTCWTVCPNAFDAEVSNIAMILADSYEARNYRNSLNGGMFGNGQITLDGQVIPLMAYDWNMINGPTQGDMYFLTGSIGSVRIWEGEHLDAGAAAREFGSIGGYQSLDGGRLLMKVDMENECRTLKLWIHPRLFCMAPWAQIRFQDIQCNWPGGPLSPDPLATSYYPQSSFYIAECP